MKITHNLQDVAKETLEDLSRMREKMVEAFKEYSGINFWSQYGAEGSAQVFTDVTKASLDDAAQATKRAAHRFADTHAGANASLVKDTTDGIIEGYMGLTKLNVHASANVARATVELTQGVASLVKETGDIVALASDDNPEAATAMVNLGGNLVKGIPLAVQHLRDATEQTFEEGAQTAKMGYEALAGDSGVRFDDVLDQGNNTMGQTAYAFTSILYAVGPSKGVAGGISKAGSSLSLGAVIAGTGEAAAALAIDTPALAAGVAQAAGGAAILASEGMGPLGRKDPLEARGETPKPTEIKGDLDRMLKPNGSSRQPGKAPHMIGAAVPPEVIKNPWWKVLKPRYEVVLDGKRRPVRALDIVEREGSSFVFNGEKLVVFDKIDLQAIEVTEYGRTTRAFYHDGKFYPIQPRQIVGLPKAGTRDVWGYILDTDGTIKPAPQPFAEVITTADGKKSFSDGFKMHLLPEDGTMITMSIMNTDRGLSPYTSFHPTAIGEGCLRNARQEHAMAVVVKGKLVKLEEGAPLVVSNHGDVMILRRNHHGHESFSDMSGQAYMNRFEVPANETLVITSDGLGYVMNGKFAPLSNAHIGKTLLDVRGNSIKLDVVENRLSLTARDGAEAVQALPLDHSLFHPTKTYRGGRVDGGEIKTISPELLGQQVVTPAGEISSTLPATIAGVDIAKGEVYLVAGERRGWVGVKKVKAFGNVQEVR